MGEGVAEEQGERLADHVRHQENLPSDDTESGKPCRYVILRLKMQMGVKGGSLTGNRDELLISRFVHLHG